MYSATLSQLKVCYFHKWLFPSSLVGQMIGIASQSMYLMPPGLHTPSQNPSHTHLWDYIHYIVKYTYKWCSGFGKFVAMGGKVPTRVPHLVPLLPPRCVCILANLCFSGKKGANSRLPEILFYCLPGHLQSGQNTSSDGTLGRLWCLGDGQRALGYLWGDQGMKGTARS